MKQVCCTRMWIFFGITDTESSKRPSLNEIMLRVSLNSRRYCEIEQQQQRQHQHQQQWRQWRWSEWRRGNYVERDEHRERIERIVHPAPYKNGTGKEKNIYALFFRSLEARIGPQSESEVCRIHGNNQIWKNTHTHGRITSVGTFCAPLVFASIFIWQAVSYSGIFTLLYLSYYRNSTVNRIIESTEPLMET